MGAGYYLEKVRILCIGGIFIGGIFFLPRAGRRGSGLHVGAGGAGPVQGPGMVRQLLPAR